MDAHTKKNDGKFWMPLDLFKSYFYNTQIAMTQDNWKQDSLVLDWNRADGKDALKWTITNPTAQEVVIALNGNSKRMFETADCDSSLQLENIPFALYNSAGQTVDHENLGGNKNWYQWLTRWDGTTSMRFTNLPEGTYTLKPVQNVSAKFSGVTQIGANTYCSDAKCVLSK